MKKFLKRLLIILLIFIVLFFAAVVIILRFFSADLGRQIIAQLNRQLVTELSVAEVDLSVLRSFPNASVNLRNIVLEDTRHRPLLTADNMAFRFGLLSLFGSNIKIHSVAISDGALTIHYDRAGRPNYEVFKTSKDETPEKGGPNISLEEAVLDQIELAYVDEKEVQEMRLLVDRAAFTGQFSADRFTLSSRALLHSHYIDMDSVTYLDDKDISYDARVAVDMEKGRYDLEDVTLTMEANTFKAFGFVENKPRATVFDLYLNNAKGDLGSLMQLLPSNYANRIANFKSSGNFEVKTLIKGELSAGRKPQIRSEVTLTNGKVTNSKMDSDLRDVSFVMTYDNGMGERRNPSFFEIKDFEGVFNRQLFEMNLRVDNLDDPSIHFKMNGALPVNLAYGLLNNPNITDGSGEVKIEALQLEGRYEDLIREQRVERATVGGSLYFDDASLTINKEKMVVDEGAVRLNGNEVAIENLRLIGAGSDLAFNGTAANIVPVLFADSLNSNNVQLTFKANLGSENLDIDRFLSVIAISADQVDTTAVSIDSLKEEQIQKRRQYTQFLNGTFDARIDEYNYDKIEGRAFQGQFIFNNNELQIKGQTQAMGGRFDLDGEMFFEQEPRLHAQLKCDKANITTFFDQTNNFGQEMLTSKNIKGTINAKIAIYAYWDQEGHFLTDRLRVLADVGIQNGELNNMELLKSFSTYVKVQDLMQIRFVNIENVLEVTNRKLYLPAMFIQSNALNLTISGEQSFDNQIAYNIKVNAGQVLANRFKSHDSQLSPQPARRKGFFNLYYNISGTLDDYKVKSAKRTVQADFEQSERRRTALQQALQQEFGSVKTINEPAEWRDEQGSGGDEFLDWEDTSGQEN